MSAREDYEIERHADPLDSATDIALMENVNRVETARLANKPEQVQNKDGSWPHTECVEPDCGDELPPQRLAMGRIRCTPCQTRKEKRRG